VKEFTIEIEGKNYLVQKHNVAVGDDGITTGYSLDRGETWWPTMIEAFKVAQEAGKLSVVGDEPGEHGEFEEFILALVAEVQALKPGESLRLMRDNVNVVAIKEQAVFAVRASTIGDVDLRMTEDKNG